MSSLANISLLYVEDEKEIQDKLKLYLNNSFREIFKSEDNQDKIEMMVSDIKRLFNWSNTLIEGQNHLYRFNKNLLYDFSSKNILDGDSVIKLNNQEIILLEHLIKNQGNTVAYETLMYIISNGSFSSIETLRTVIKRVRAKIGKSVIETISKVGYRLVV